MKRRPILKNSLLNLYRDSDEITNALYLLDFTKLDYAFYKALFTHISEDDFWRIDDYLNGDEVARYHHAVSSAAMSCTTELAQIIEFTLQERENGGLH